MAEKERKMASICPICGSSFSRQDNLKRHMANFHGEKISVKDCSTQTPETWHSRLAGGISDSGKFVC